LADEAVEAQARVKALGLLDPCGHARGFGQRENSSTISRANCPRGYRTQSVSSGTARPLFFNILEPGIPP
jgi:hypothetical protein